MALSAYITVPGPIRTAHSYGLFSAIPVETISDPHALNGVQWEALTCTPPTTASVGCCNYKDLTPTPGLGSADPFAVVGWWRCQLLGFTPEQAAQRAREHLEVGEQYAVEHAVWTGVSGARPHLASPDTVDLGEVHCASDLLSVLLAYAARFVGQPVLHVPTPVLPYLAAARLMTTVGGTRLETPWGVPIAAGAGYTVANTGPDGTPAPAGSWWVYITGPMRAWRGPVVSSPDPAAYGFDRRTNDMLALAERTYLVGWDCFAAAVLFTPCCECGPPTGAPAPPDDAADEPGSGEAP